MLRIISRRGTLATRGVIREKHEWKQHIPPPGRIDCKTIARSHPVSGVNHNTTFVSWHGFMQMVLTGTKSKYRIEGWANLQHTHSPDLPTFPPTPRALNKHGGLRAEDASSGAFNSSDQSNRCPCSHIVSQACCSVGSCNHRVETDSSPVYLEEYAMYNL